MSIRRIIAAAGLTLGFSLGLAAQSAQTTASKTSQRNVIIFVADGLRAGSVNPTDAPTLYTLRQQGVYFANSHAMFPTFTTPNASAIATGHYLGDTGDFSNTLYSGYPVYNTGSFGKTSGTNTPFVEDDQILADLDEHFGGNWLNEDSLLAIARAHGYNTAAIGKLGPVAIQDVSQVNPQYGQFATPKTVIIDDRTGSATGVPLSDQITAALTGAGLGTTPTPRNQPAGNNTTPGTTSPNTGQQQWFADATTKAVLPTFAKTNAPFALVYWSRDPDGSQHNQGDSLNKLTPGINGPTSRAAIKNADNNLAQILAYVMSDPKLANNTDIFITADHGFAAISKHEIDATGKHFTQSYAAKFIYKDSTGRQEVNTGFLPVGFLAIDIAHALNLALYDPDAQITDNTGHSVYKPVDPTIPQQTATVNQHSGSGDALIGGSGKVLDGTDADVVIAANGGSDLIYVPDHNYARLQKIVQFLSKQDYVGGLFVDDSYGTVPGALPLSSINLVGTAQTPTPSIVVNFKTFYLDPNNLLSAVQIADSSLQEGQGMHGSLGRDNTFNNMAAWGPDFRKSYVDKYPVSNADIARTLSKVMHLQLPNNGKLIGRVLYEALANGEKVEEPHQKRLVSTDASGKSTVLQYQQMYDRLYFDVACFSSSPHSSKACD